jgi:hypothetical protein
MENRCFNGLGRTMELVTIEEKVQAILVMPNCQLSLPKKYSCTKILGETDFLYGLYLLN